MTSLQNHVPETYYQDSTPSFYEAHSTAPTMPHGSMAPQTSVPQIINGGPANNAVVTGTSVVPNVGTGSAGPGSGTPSSSTSVGNEAFYNDGAQAHFNGGNSDTQAQSVPFFHNPTEHHIVGTHNASMGQLPPQLAHVQSHARQMPPSQSHTPTPGQSQGPSSQTSTPQQFVPSQPQTSNQAPAPEQPFYVNAKQYHRILKRRIARAKLEENLKIARTRRPYLHESRHKHAMRRPRGQGGRFLTAAEILEKERLEKLQELENKEENDNVKNEQESSSMNSNSEETDKNTVPSAISEDDTIFQNLINESGA